MNTDLLFRVAAIGIAVAVLNQILIKSDRSEQAWLVTLAGVAVAVAAVAEEIGGLFDTIRAVFGL